MHLLPNQVITGRLFKSTIKTPIVYGWTRDGSYLYIGKTLNGFGRLIHHNIINVIEKLLDTDEIVIWYGDKTNIEKLEKELINLYKPKYNIESKVKLKLRKCSLCKQKFETFDKDKKHCNSCQKRIEYITNGTIFV